MDQLTRKIKLHLRPYLIKLLSLIKVYPTEMIESDDILCLLKKIRPLLTDKSLIRLGPKGDGGYLVPDDLIGISACFSPGVSSTSRFEKDCADIGMKVFLADKSVDQPAEEHNQFHFRKKFVGVTSDEEFMTIDDWVANSELDENSDLLMQVDIEGYEYELFLSISDSLMQRFRIIIVEFHKLDELWSRPYFKLASRVFDKILQTHACIHMHPNNAGGSLRAGGLEIPRVIEFTFLRYDRITHKSFQKNFPNPLDADNTPKSTITLPTCWYVME